jgi:predicted permease
MVLTLAVGIGLNTGVFAILDGLMFRPHIEKDPGSFVQVLSHYTGWYPTEDQFQEFTALDYQAMRDQTRSLSILAARHEDNATLENETKQTTVILVTCNFFSLYGLDRPKLGRLLLPEECATPGSVPVAVIGEELWRQRFASDPQIIGKSIRLNRQPFTVVGVVPAHFSGRLAGPGIWIPYTMQPEFWHGHDAFSKSDWYDWAWLTVEGRLKPGYSRPDAQAELGLIVGRQDRLYPGSKDNRAFPGRKTTVVVTNGSIIEQPRVRPFAVLLIPLILGPLLLVLLIACANVTMLLLSRATARRSEIAIRLALGAGRGRLLRMLALEGLIVVGAAGAISLFLAYEIPVAFQWFIPDAINFQTRPDLSVLAYLAGITFLAGCIAGLAPAAESLRVDLVTVLKGKEGASTAKSRTRGILIVAQVAMTFVLLAGAALFIRIQLDITSVDPGFETRHVFLVDEEYPGPAVGPNVTLQQYRDSVISFFDMLDQRVRALPSVVSVAYAQAMPFVRADTQEIRLPNQAKGNGRQASLDVVSANFFETLGVPIVHGRAFQSSDVTTESHLPAEKTDYDARAFAPVGVVSQAFARTFWPGQDPLGKVVEWGDPVRQVQIVGVARDTKSEEFGTLDGPRLYALMNYDFGGPLMVRFTGDAGALAPEIEKAVQSVDPGRILVPTTLRSMLEEAANDTSALTQMVLFLAILAIALSVIGIYAVVSFSMSQRTRELGIRMVLGATKGRIVGSVLASGVGQIGIGLLFGLLLALPGSWALARLFQRAPFHISVFDFGAFGMAAALLAGVALAAMFIPARHAARVDPMVALRYE